MGDDSRFSTLILVVMALYGVGLYSNTRKKLPFNL